ncbi:unnamed protein product [Choristocarpus tenellus]
MASVSSSMSSTPLIPFRSSSSSPSYTSPSATSAPLTLGMAGGPVRGVGSMMTPLTAFTGSRAMSSWSTALPSSGTPSSFTRTSGFSISNATVSSGLSGSVSTTPSFSSWAPGGKAEAADSTEVGGESKAPTSGEGGARAAGPWAGTLVGPLVGAGVGSLAKSVFGTRMSPNQAAGGSGWGTTPALPVPPMGVLPSKPASSLVTPVGGAKSQGLGLGRVSAASAVAAFSSGTAPAPTSTLTTAMGGGGGGERTPQSAVLEKVEIAPAPGAGNVSGVSRITEEERRSKRRARFDGQDASKRGRAGAPPAKGDSDKEVIELNDPEDDDPV